MATARVERVVADSGRLLPAYKVCKHPGCRKQITRKGLCWSHLREAGMDPQPGRKVARKQGKIKLVAADPFAGIDAGKSKPTITETVQTSVMVGDVPFAAPLPDPAPDPYIPHNEFYLEQMQDELRRLFDARLDLWRQELLEARNMREQAQWFLDMCARVESLGW